MAKRIVLLKLFAFVFLGNIALAETYQHGVDVSKWQGVIDWGEIRAAGTTFAFVKATGYDWDVDPKFQYNISNANAWGIKAGPYHRAWPSPEPNDAIAEADHFVDVAGAYMTTGYLRPVLDLESGNEMGKAALTAWIHAFMDRVEQRTGIEPLIYCNQYYAENFFEQSVGNYDVWFARWTHDYNIPPTRLGVFDEWAFWQYTDQGQIPGAHQSTYIDRDVCRDITPYIIPQTHSNTAPVANQDYYSVHVSDVLNVAAPGVLANDTDAEGDSLSAAIEYFPSHGDLSFNSDGSFTYDPEASYRGTDRFYYKASDGLASSAMASISVTVYNNATAADDTYTLDEGSSFTVDKNTGITSNDMDIDDDVFGVFLQDDVEHGTLNLNMDGSFTYVPTLGFSGTDQFTYHAADAWDTSEIATVTFNILAADIPGDANRDGKVDGSDVTILAGNWQVQSGATWDMGDFNADGKVDGSDVTILAGNWQAGITSSAASVPEPGTILLLLTGVGFVLSPLRFRREKSGRS